MDISQEVITHLQVLRNYMIMWHELKKSDLIFVLCSYDTRVAERAADLYHAGYADTILVSWWMGLKTSLDERFKYTSESEEFAKIMIEKGVPKSVIIIENKSTNTWENIRFSYELIKDKHIKSMIIVQKPYMERRAFATFMKQWPWDPIHIRITSPQLSLEECLDSYHEWPEELIHTIVWYIDRIIKYPALWYQIEQPISDEVLWSFHALIALWYTGHVVP
jgi:uncharacterized SAM-binding protein YcdF (DUF218 family)